MKKLLLSLWVLMTSLTTMAQGWPSQYEGVMLQGFYWDSYTESKWTVMESQADELATGGVLATTTIPATTVHSEQRPSFVP